MYPKVVIQNDQRTEERGSARHRIPGISVLPAHGTHAAREREPRMDSQDNVCGKEPEIVIAKGSIHSSRPANGKPLVRGLKQAFTSSFVLNR